MKTRAFLQEYATYRSLLYVLYFLNVKMAARFAANYNTFHEFAKRQGVCAHDNK